MARPQIRDAARQSTLQPWTEGLALRLGSPAEHPLQFVGIAGCSPGDGATTVACTVAERLQSRFSKRVLLVDGNFADPRLHGLFGLSPTPGLTDLLEGRSTLGEAVRPVAASGLCVITAGAPKAGSLGGFESDAFAAMKAGLLEYFDTVIFDCAPLNGRDGGTFMLAQRLDGLVMVLAAEETRWENGAQLMDRLRAADINVLGAVLNRKRFHIPRFLYDRL